MTATALYANNGGKPKFNEIITPIGKVVHCYHDTAQVETDDKTKKIVLDDKGFPKATFKVTLMWPAAELHTTLIPMRQLAAVTRDEAWGPTCAQPDPATGQSWFRLEAFLRDGNNPEHNTMKREYLFNHVYLNFKARAIPILDQQGNHTGRYSGAPQLIGPNKEDLMPSDMYAGCRGRVSCILFGTEYMGRKFISNRLNNIQKAEDGERMSGGRPDAKSQFDALAPAAGAFGGLNGALGGRPTMIL